MAEATGNTTDRNVAGGSQQLTWNAENKPTSTRSAADGAVEIVSSGKRLDLQSNAATDGTDLQVATCAVVARQQRARAESTTPTTNTGQLHLDTHKVFLGFQGGWGPEGPPAQP
ncbi:hypothetical protein [Streptomyces sp. NPDC058664]|uniref:hypothetical protein n=1 Tax=unclassified Streptomyces TaxID=2593676 RepID=UPI00365B4F66